MRKTAPAVRRAAVRRVVASTGGGEQNRVAEQEKAGGEKIGCGRTIGCGESRVERKNGRAVRGVTGEREAPHTRGRIPHLYFLQICLWFVYGISENLAIEYTYSRKLYLPFFAPNRTFGAVKQKKKGTFPQK